MPFIHNGMAHFLFMHFPHSFPIGPPWDKLNFASEKEERKRLKKQQIPILQKYK